MMSNADYVRMALSGPRASCMVDLYGFGDMFTETATAIYLSIDPERSHGSDDRSLGLRWDSGVRVIHAVSRWHGGEVRGYVWHGDRLYVRHPASPKNWPELDTLVEQATGATIKVEPPQSVEKASER